MLLAARVWGETLALPWSLKWPWGKCTGEVFSRWYALSSLWGNYQGVFECQIYSPHCWALWVIFNTAAAPTAPFLVEYHQDVCLIKAFLNPKQTEVDVTCCARLAGDSLRVVLFSKLLFMFSLFFVAKKWCNLSEYWVLFSGLCPRRAPPWVFSHTFKTNAGS